MPHTKAPLVVPKRNKMGRASTFFVLRAFRDAGRGPRIKRRVIIYSCIIHIKQLLNPFSQVNRLMMTHHPLYSDFLIILQ
jgi:hypothetical protein